MLYNFALLGDPVEHSLSPQIHSQFFQKSGLKGGYVCIQTSPGKLLTSIRSLQELGFKGLNLTIPHKEAALELADSCSPEVELIGASNTFIFEDNGIIRAENTDWIGFLDSLPAKNRQETKIASILGAGGSAKAVLMALLKLNLTELQLIIRHSESSEVGAQALQKIAHKLKPELKLQVYYLGELTSELSQTDLIVNTTPVGMHSYQENLSPLKSAELKSVKKSCYFYDLIYNPAKTKFLLEAESPGHAVQNGYRMLELQAAHAFSLWTGFPLDKLL